MMGLSFGALIAYLLPGFIFLWGLSFSRPEVASWLAMSGAKDSPTIGGFLYSTLASLSLGLLISAIRWLIIDHLHHVTGLKRPNMNFANLKDRLAAFQAAADAHYRHYQYLANSLIAILAAFASYLLFANKKASLTMWIIVAGISIALFFGSRDALKKYYVRAGEILN